MKDNEFYRPAESGIRAQEMPADRDEFARPDAVPAQPGETPRRHGRLLQLLCGAAAVAVIAQAALPAGTAASAFAAPLQWEEITLLGKPVKDVEVGELAAAYGPGNVRSNSQSYARQTEDGYEITFYTRSMSAYFDSSEPDAGEHYSRRDRGLTSTDPDLALEIRGLAIGMDVQEVVERIGFSENVWDLITDLAPEHQKDDSELLQAFTFETEKLLDEYGIQNVVYTSYDRIYYRLSAGEGRSDDWWTQGRDPYHGEWKVEIWFGRRDRYDEDGDYLDTVGSDVECNRLRLTFEDGRLREFYIRALGDPIPDDEPEQAPTPTLTPEPASAPEPAPTPPAAMPSAQIIPSEPVEAAATGYHLLAGGWQNGGGLYYNGQPMQPEIYSSADEQPHPMPELPGQTAGGDTLLISTSFGDAYTLYGDEFASFTPAGIRIRAPGYTLVPGIEFVNVPGAYFHVYQDGQYLFSFVYQYGGVSDVRLVFVARGGELYSADLAPDRDAALEQAMDEFVSACTVTETSETNTIRIGRSLQLNDNGAMFYTLDAFYDAQTRQGYKGPYFNNMSGPWSYAGTVDAKNSTQPIEEDIYQKGDMILRIADMVSSTQLYILPLYNAESEWVWGLAPQHVRVGLLPEAAVRYTVNGVTWRVIYEPSSQVKLGGGAPTPEPTQDSSGIRVNGESGNLFGWSAYLYCESEPQFAFAVRGDAESMEGSVRQLLGNFSLAG